MRQYDSQYAPSVQLFWRIVIALIGRPRRTDREVSAHDLVDDVAHLRQLGPQVVVDVDEVLRGRELVRRVAFLRSGIRPQRVRRAGRLVPRQGRG